MRNVLKVFPLIFLGILAVGFAAQAGGNGAVKVDLYEADIDPDSGRAVPVDPLVVAGYVIFNPTANGKMEITIKLDSSEGDAAKKAFDVIIVPSGPWKASDQAYTLSTNGNGQGTLHIQPDIPSVYSETAQIKVRLSYKGTDLAYATIIRGVSLKK